LSLLRVAADAQCCQGRAPGVIVLPGLGSWIGGAGLAAQVWGWLPRCGASCPGAGLAAQVWGWLPR
jgi:hypothetical protein